MKMPNRCPECKKLVFGTKKVRNKGSFFRYKTFCPYCGVELKIEIKSYLLFFVPVCLAVYCFSFVVKNSNPFFSKLIMAEPMSLWLIALIGAKLLAFVLPFTALVLFVIFIANKTITWKKAEPE